MNKISIIIFFALLTLTSCTDFFETQSGSVLKTDGQTYKNELEARSGMFGLLQGLQTIGDNYLIMGELRGDLMTVTSNSSQELRDINDFQINKENSYLKEREYYALLNNCNYYISKLDTTYTSLVNGQAQKVLYPYLAQAKAIRAWTYLQLCLDYGSVKYATKPVLDANAPDSTTEVDLEGLLPRLINDLEGILPWMVSDNTPLSATWIQGNADPGFSTSVSYESFSARQLMFPVRFVLGELYLWNRDFLKAAQTYYDLIYLDKLKMTGYRNLLDVTGTYVSNKSWPNQFDNFNYADILTAIAFTNEYKDNATRLYDLFNTNYVLAPSQALINTFDEQYYYTGNRAISGDLRGTTGTYSLKTIKVGENDVENAYVTKFASMTANGQYYIAPCRSALVYLRYAEAVNRLGKSKFAFYGFLKFGLCEYNINLYKNKSELSGEIKGEPYIEFGQSNPNGPVASLFSVNNYGMHARGCGYSERNESYKLETQASQKDTIEWVEEQLVNEYALETALEGNRFHDLMRIARYRNDNAYLAGKVSAKFPSGQREQIYNHLLTKENWYLPKSE
ncbi:MAG TPA: hypothetical protein VFP20_10490 [Bacteroidales bacterium]|nr:hypothetical protein [Bacteroidales bacterium]